METCKSLWRRRWHPTPVLLPGKSHGRKSLVGYSPWGRKDSDTTEQLHSLTCGILKKNEIGDWGLTKYILLLLLSCFSCVRLCATP